MKKQELPKEAKQSRGWILTLPLKKFTEEEVIEKMGNWPFAGQLEKGESGYMHWQLLIESPSPIAFSTLLRRFKGGHFEPRRGTVAEALAYCTKQETSTGIIWR